MINIDHSRELLCLLLEQQHLNVSYAIDIYVMPGSVTATSVTRVYVHPKLKACTITVFVVARHDSIDGDI